MPYPAGTLRFIMKGLLFNTQDWSIGIAARTTEGVVYSYDVLQAFIQANSSIFVTAYNSLATVRSNQCTFSTLRLEQYTGGNEAATINEYGVTGQTIGTTAPVHPAYASLCIGTLTGRPGGSYRGRIYIPALGAGVSPTTGFIGAPDQTTARTAMATLISAINDLTLSGDPITAVVASRTTVSSAPITQVRSDQVLDVQRRRNNDFARSYVTSPIT